MIYILEYLKNFWEDQHILFQWRVQGSLLDEKTHSDDTEDAWAGRMSSAVWHR